MAGSSPLSEDLKELIGLFQSRRLYALCANLPNTHLRPWPLKK